MRPKELALTTQSQKAPNQINALASRFVKALSEIEEERLKMIVQNLGYDDPGYRECIDPGFFFYQISAQIEGALEPNSEAWEQWQQIREPISQANAWIALFDNILRRAGIRPDIMRKRNSEFSYEEVLGICHQICEMVGELKLPEEILQEEFGIEQVSEYNANVFVAHLKPSQIKEMAKEIRLVFGDNDAHWKADTKEFMHEINLIFAEVLPKGSPLSGEWAKVINNYYLNSTVAKFGPDGMKDVTDLFKAILKSYGVVGEIECPENPEETLRQIEEMCHQICDRVLNAEHYTN